MDISSFLLPIDLTKLSKSTLKDIGLELDLNNDLNKTDLAINIYEKVKNLKNIEKKNNIESLISTMVFAGRVSCKWYKINSLNFKDKIKSIFLEKYSEQQSTIKMPEKTSLKTTPEIIAIIDNENEMIIRFTYKSSFKQDLYGDELTVTAVPAYSMLIINFDKNFIEYRGDSKKSLDTLEVIKSLLEEKNYQINLTEIQLSNIEEIADKIDGELIDASTTIDQTLLDDGKLEGISKVLSSLDEYFIDKDISELNNNLSEVYELFDGNIGSDVAPFSSVILSGLDMVGLSGNSELRNLPLYNYLKPNLTTHTGYIKFEYDDGIEKSDYTFKVGVATKSIYFKTPVKEEVIKHFREKVIY